LLKSAALQKSILCVAETYFYQTIENFVEVSCSNLVTVEMKKSTL